MSAEPMFEGLRFWAKAFRALHAAGMLAPAAVVSLARGFATQGASMSVLAALGAALHAERIAVADERGVLSFGELHERVERIATALRQRFGLGAGRTMALLCRNHRGFVEAALAGTRLGCDLLFLNVDFPGAQLEQVFSDAGVDLLVHDEEFSAAVAASGFRGHRVIGWCESTPPAATLDELAACAPAMLPRIRRAGRLVVLTSGTTGLPKGAARVPRLSAFLSPFVTFLSRLPLGRHMPVLVATPLFHGFGLAAMGMALSLGAPMILRRRFDANECARLLSTWQVGALVVVPLMLRRLLPVLPRQPELASLRAIVCGGAPLAPDLVCATEDNLPGRLFNLYGTSEAGFACMAGPDELRARPTTVGRAGEGVRIRIVDEAGLRLAPGLTGRVCIGGEMICDDNASGGRRRRWIDTGDMGHFDAERRLFLCGRADDMVVCGGENVHPVEVENLLLGHHALDDAVVVAVDDPEFGKRLHAFVVARRMQRITADELRTYLRTRLARYKIPASIEFRERLPRSALGKPLKPALIAETSAPAGSCGAPRPADAPGRLN